VKGNGPERTAFSRASTLVPLQSENVLCGLYIMASENNLFRVPRYFVRTVREAYGTGYALYYCLVCGNKASKKLVFSLQRGSSYARMPVLHAPALVGCKT